MPLQLINQALLDATSAAAKAAPRLRKNHNFHPTDDYPGHRLLNAIELGSYIPPHRHLDPLKDETMLVLRGKLGVVFFDDDGKVTQVFVAQAGGKILGVDIPHGTWHSVLALEADTVFFEAKSGPYLALTDAEKASWAPAENSPEAVGYQAQLAALFGNA